MSALPKPDYDTPEVMSSIPLNAPRPLRPVETLESLVPPVAPPWLDALVLLKRCSTPLAWLFVAVVIPFYGLSVMTQRTWGQQYQSLQELQRQEQQLAAEQAMARSRVAEQSLQNRRLVPQIPANSVFLRTAPARSVAANPQAPNPTVPATAAKPLSY
jgi:hypothetical protein